MIEVGIFSGHGLIILDSDDVVLGGDIACYHNLQWNNTFYNNLVIADQIGLAAKCGNKVSILKQYLRCVSEGYGCGTFTAEEVKEKSDAKFIYRLKKVGQSSLPPPYNGYNGSFISLEPMYPKFKIPRSRYANQLPLP